VDKGGNSVCPDVLMLFGTITAALAYTLSGIVYGGIPLANTGTTLTNANSRRVGTATTDANGTTPSR
jgi:hypothetical protein